MIAIIGRMLFPFSITVGFAIWAKGYAEVGDGFSAGAFAGLGAVVQYICLDHEEAARIILARWTWWFVGGGLLLALAVLIGPALFGGVPVTHVPAPGQPMTKIGVLELHTALLFDLGVAVLVYGLLVGTFDRVFPPLRGGMR